MTPTPPTSYMLRELKEVGLPDPVSWLPQTLGWKLLLALLLGFIAYRIYQKLTYWWQNRYRQEAIEAVQRLSEDDPQWPWQMMKIIKIVMVYLEPKNAPLYGEPLLRQMENYQQSHTILADQLFQQWIKCLEDPNVAPPDFPTLSNELIYWLNQHRLQETAHESA